MDSERKKKKKSSTLRKVSNAQLEDWSKSSHSFQIATFSRFTYCTYCSKFIWGLAHQGYKCEVCNYVAHRKCKKKADKTTSCNTRFTNEDDGKLRRMSLKEKRKALNALCVQLSEGDVIHAIKVKTFILLLGSSFEELEDETTYECFHHKRVPHAVPTNRSLICEDGNWDTIELLKNYITMGADPEHNDAAETQRIIALKILRELLKDNEDIIAHFSNGIHLGELVLSLALDLDVHTYPYYGLMLDIIYLVLKGDEKRMNRFFESGALDPVVNLSLELSSIVEKDRSLRNLFNDTKLSGAKIIALFYQKGDYKFSNYIEQKNALPVFLEFVEKNALKIHKEIRLDEIETVQCIYDSLLCKVYRGLYDGKEVAIKMFDTESFWSQEDFYKEIGLLTILQGASVCKFYGAHTKSSKPFIVIEFFNRGSLENVTSKEKLKKKGIEYVSPNLIINLALSSCIGISYLHDKNIIHRDIKTQNFLVDDYFNVKVIDFGVSRVAADNEEKMTLIGTPVWMAPEVLGQDTYSFPADNYSLASVFWAMFVGKQPYDDIAPLELATTVCIEKIREPIPDFIPPEVADLIHRGWSHEPLERPTLEEMIDTLYNLRHPDCQIGEHFHEGHFITHCHDNVEDDIFIDHIIPLLDLPELGALSMTSTRFSALIEPTLDELKPEDHLDLYTSASIDKPKKRKTKLSSTSLEIKDTPNRRISKNHKRKKKPRASTDDLA